MNYRFSPEARVDLLAAADFYETQQAGLGTEFAVDVGLGLARLLEAPRRWPEIELGIRRYRLDRFPYGLIYRIASARMVEIIAVFDLRRRPGSWRDRDS
ncbi:MAG: type II toxin-antitoxin system RelE/ParE family toxin [Tepidisphaeraceae bacterium]|jgi:plasmid stabilization system protein ParE